MPESTQTRLKTKGNSVTFGNPEKPQLGTFRINFNLNGLYIN